MFVFSSVPMKYEGLTPPPHTYSLNRNTDDLFDSDGDIVQIRNLVYAVE